MCGISGIAHSPQRASDVSEALLVRMRDALHHRGPDDAGVFVEGPVGLALRRLSIVDLATGHQPMANEDRSLVIVYNGEIFNHADHRPGLEARGHVFATRSDTETILHLYEDYGDRCVEHLRGMFAFAIWNRRTKELFVARDRLGVKPLYYVHADDGSLFFGSEIKALLAANAIRPTLHVAALPEYLANRATSGATTLFAGVQRLPPGHTLRWKDGKVEIRCYWDARPGDVPEDGARAVADCIDEWRELFRTSVRLRLMADVPLGLFLSGGIDSSAIAGVMSQMVAEPIKTFSVAFNDPEATELEYARLAAQAFGTDHHEVLVEPSDFAAALPHLIWHEDEPIGHPASVPLYFVSQLAQRHVKVVLTGEGSDELLAGYYRYRTTLLNLSAGRLYHRFSTDRIRRFVRSVAAGVAPASLARKLPRTFLWRTPDIDALYFDNFAVFTRHMQRDLFSKELRGQLEHVNPHAGMRHYFDAPSSASVLQRLLYADLKTHLHELLMKQDQMSMAASVESRVPFLDHKLVEFSTALPDRLKLRGWTTKYVLREAMKGLVPEAILRRGKMGFPVPLGRWFRGAFRPLLDEFVVGERAVARGLFQPDVLQRLVQEHAAGRADHTERLWALVNFEMWQRQFLDGETRKGTLPQIEEAPRHRSSWTPRSGAAPR
jgi:asparagine synthase (glutamine-hydrolysing)